MPVFAPDALNKQRSFCPRAMDIAGITDAEGVKVQVRAAESKGDPLRTAMAIFYVQAQIRGAVRAGALTGGQLVEAIGAGTSPYEAVLRAAVRLYDGSAQFAKAQSSRRVIAACVGASCAGVDRQQVRKYVSGAMTLAAIDQEAQRRVGSGACRAAYPKNERTLQHLFVAATGGLSGIGLARTSQPEGRLVPDSPATYSTFATRSKLDGDTARLGVRLANGIGKSETYWKGAIVLDSGVLDGSTFGRALVWVEDGRIARIIVNLSDEAKMPGLAEELSRLYGEPAMSDATKTRWTLESGRTATLDLGAAAELVVE